MQFSSKLFLTVLGALLAAHAATAAPVEVLGRTDAEALTADMAMIDDFSISDLKNALSTAASVIQKIGTAAKPVADAAAKVASGTSLAPEAAAIDTAVNDAANLKADLKLPVKAIQGAASALSKIRI